MNLHGRIWIGNLLLFGLASVVIVLFIDPVFFVLVEKLRPFWLHLLAIAIVVLMIGDHMASSALMKIVRKEIDAQEGDNTEEITQRVHLLLRDRNLLLRRIEQAYPDLQSQPHWLTVQIKQAWKNHRAASRQAAQLLKKSRKGSVPEEELDAALMKEKHTLLALRILQKKRIRHREQI